jgi:CheY-like chemotaxis protein
MEKKKLKVLLVDDDEINRQVATVFLDRMDISVANATNGKQALELIRTKSFNLVMMDLQMPEMDGYECTCQIREMKDPYFKNLPIIVFSASSLIDSRKKAMELGMTDFMNKPYSQEELKDKISQYLPLPSREVRLLKIDFSLHTDGDPFFKLELMQLLTDNLAELNRSLDHALESADHADFFNIAHKVSSAVSILNEPELTTSVDLLKQCLKKGAPASCNESISRFRQITRELVRAMDSEMKFMQKMTQKP